MIIVVVVVVGITVVTLKSDNYSSDSTSNNKHNSNDAGNDNDINNNNDSQGEPRLHSATCIAHVTHTRSSKVSINPSVSSHNFN